VGPIDLEVGCKNYIDATLSQDTGTLTQQVIGAGTADKLEFTVDESNIGSDGNYRLNLNGFASLK